MQLMDYRNVWREIMSVNKLMQFDVRTLPHVVSCVMN